MTANAKKVGLLRFRSHRRSLTIHAARSRSRSPLPRGQGKTASARDREPKRNRTETGARRAERRPALDPKRSTTTQSKADTHTQDAGDSAVDDSDAILEKIMGFTSFSSTKGKKVPGNDRNYGVSKAKKSEYRQYMVYLSLALSPLLSGLLTWRKEPKRRFQPSPFADEGLRNFQQEHRVKWTTGGAAGHANLAGFPGAVVAEMRGGRLRRETCGQVECGRGIGGGVMSSGHGPCELLVTSAETNRHSQGRPLTLTLLSLGCRSSAAFRTFTTDQGYPRSNQMKFVKVAAVSVVTPGAKSKEPTSDNGVGLRSW